MTSVQHVVLLKWKHGAPEAQINESLAEMRALGKLVPGVTSAAVGASLGDRAHGYTHAFVATLADRDALEQFGPHPAHQAMRAKLPAIMEELLVFDFVDDGRSVVGEAA